MNFIKIVWKHKFGIASFVFVITVIAIAISLMLPKWYKATSTIMPPSENQTPLGSISALTGLNLGGIIGGNAEQTRLLAILKSRSLKEAVAERYNLMQEYGTENMEQTLKSLGGNMTIVIGKEEQISVGLYDQNQERVAEMTNYMVHVLDSINIALNNAEGQNVRQFIQKRTLSVIDSLTNLEQQLSSFLSDNDVFSLEDQVSAGVMNAAELKAEIIQKQIEYDVLEKTKGVQDPQSIITKMQIDTLQNRYKQFFSNTHIENELFPNFKDVPRLGMKIEEVKRKIQYYKKIIEFLGPQYEQAKIEETKNVPTLQVIDQAIQPEKKSKPQRMKIVFVAFLFSSILSIYFVYFRERFSANE